MVVGVVSRSDILCAILKNIMDAQTTVEDDGSIQAKIICELQKQSLGPSIQGMVLNGKVKLYGVIFIGNA